MTDLLGARLRIEAPAGWHRVPADGLDGWAATLVGGAGEEAVAALAAVGAAANAEPPRVPFVHLGGGPVARAWAFLRVVPREEADAEAAAAAAERVLAGPAHGDVEVWHREVVRVTVGEAPGVLLTDLLTLPRAPHDREVQLRAVLAWFPPEAICLHLTISTPSSTLGDPGVEARAFAAGIRLERA
jgi:hypothetical protein